MAYIIGAMSTLLLLALLAGVYWLGTKHRSKHKPEPLSEEDKRKAVQLRKDFSEIMGYDVAQARGERT